MRLTFRIGWAACACLAVMPIASPLLAEAELTLRQAVEMALSNNPALAAGRLSAQAAREAARGARALANPEIVVAPTAAGEAGSDSAVLFSQPLEINGSRRTRGDIASHESAAAIASAEALERDTALSVSQTYWDVVRDQELVKLSEENLAYLETIGAAVRKQYEVGTAPGAQVLKTDVELARARQDLAVSRLALTQSRAELNRLMGRPVGTGFTASQPLRFQETSLDRDKLLASALSGRPEITAAQAVLSASRAGVRAARLRRVPDVALQARRESFERGSDGGVALAVSLPFLDWGSSAAEERRARAESQSREKQLEATRDQIAVQIEEAVARVTTASRIVKGFEGDILAKSEELAAMARKGYEKGASSYLEVLEAQRTLRSVRTDYYSALAEHAKALAQLEWASASEVRASGKSVGPAVTEVKG